MARAGGTQEPTPLIAFASVTKGFGAKTVLKALKLEIPRGQKLAIHGWIYGLHDGLLRDLDICITQPEEIAPAYVFLASDSDSSYITGVVLPEMGGETSA